MFSAVTAGNLRAMAKVACLAILISLLSGCAVTTRGSLGAGEPSVSLLEQTSFTALGCPGGGPKSVLSNLGIFKGCLRVGTLGAGSYFVALRPVIPGGRGVVEGQPTATSGGGPKVTIGVSPEVGKPGTTISVTGQLSAPLVNRPAKVNLCWDGCASGLEYFKTPIRWLSPTRFNARIAVPEAPWFDYADQVVVQDVPGTYAVSLDCRALELDCSASASTRSSGFRLVGSGISYLRCQKWSACADLGVPYTTVYPGDVVMVTGFAPVFSLQGGLPDSPQIVLVKRHTPGLPVREISNNGMVVPEIVSSATVNVGESPEFNTLGKIHPVNIAYGGTSPITQNPSNPGQTGWCSGDNIFLSTPKGTSGISTALALSVLSNLGYTGMGGNAPLCTSLGIGDGGRSGKVVLAAFRVQLRDDPLRVANVALSSSDGGADWMPIPIPPGSFPEGFAGFRYAGSSLQALFAPSVSSTEPTTPDENAVPLVETLGAGGLTWHRGVYSCPQRGSCILFGSTIAGLCTSGSEFQPIFYSTDFGRRWARPSWANAVDNCNGSQLVSVSSDVSLLIEGGSRYHIRESTDGGSSWIYVSLPAIPGEDSTVDSYGGNTHTEMLMLPNGSLLASGAPGGAGDWLFMSAGSKSWCNVTGVPKEVQSSSSGSALYLVGESIDWLSTGKSGSVDLNSVALQSLKC